MSEAIGGLAIKTPKPILMFHDDVLKLGCNIGTRGNGKDQHWWPEDWIFEVVP